jgi:hypothetical protein
MDDPNNTKYRVICNVVTGNPTVDAWMWLFEQLIVYIIWQYPFFYIFWLKKHSISNNSQKENLMRDTNAMSVQFDSNYEQTDGNRRESTTTLTISEM